MSSNLRYNLEDIIFDIKFVLEGEKLEISENNFGLKFALKSHQIFLHQPNDYPGCGEYYLGVSLILEPNTNFKTFKRGYQTNKILCVSTNSVKEVKEDNGVIAIFQPSNSYKTGVAIWKPGTEQVYQVVNGLQDITEFYISDLKGSPVPILANNFKFEECSLQIMVIKKKRMRSIYGE